MNRFYFRKFRTFFNEPPAVPPVSPPPPPPPPAGKTFTQDEVNRMLAENKRSLQEQNQQLAADLQKIRDTAKLTQEEKDSLDTRIATLTSQHQTETQKLQGELEATKKKYKTDTEALAAGEKRWRTNFDTLLINNAITVGAAKHQAADPTGRQLQMMLSSQAKVVEVVDDSGQPTGRYQALLPITVIGKDKKPVVMELPIEEAIGKMREDESNANLFLTDGKPGLGGTGGVGSGGKSGQTNWAKLTPAEHREARKKA